MQEMFPGFSQKAITFFQDLSENNNKTWFHEHKDIYDQYILQAQKDFVIHMNPPLIGLHKNIHAEPRVNGSIFRINRDIRFSKIKVPYKTWMALYFWVGAGKRMNNPGFYIHISPHGLMFGAGMKDFPKEMLARYRKAVVDKKKGGQLIKILNQAKKDGYTVGGKKYKRIPRGFDSNHKNAELLLHNTLTVMLETPLPKELFTTDCVPFFLHHFKKLKNVLLWLEDIC